MLSPHTILKLTIIIYLLPLQAGEDYKVTLQRSFDRCITIDSSAINIEHDSQLILPVTDGKSITVPLNQEALYSFQSVRNLIKETKDNDDFFLLASYRHRLPGGTTSSLTHADGSNVVRWSNDPVTNQPIVKADFHEFCHIKGKLAVRYLENRETLRCYHNILSLATLRPPLDELPNNVLMNLAKLHVDKGDPERAKKYIRKISPDFFNYKETIIKSLDFATICLQQHEIEVAIEILNKIVYLTPEPTFLLYKIYQEEDNENCAETCCYIGSVILNALAKNPAAMIELGNAYLLEAVKKGWNSRHAKDFLILAYLHHKDAAEQGSVSAMFCFMRDLSFVLNDDQHTHIAPKTDLTNYANRCIDAINAQNNNLIERTKKELPLDYEKTVAVIKKYGTKEIKS